VYYKHYAQAAAAAAAAAASDACLHIVLFQLLVLATAVLRTVHVLHYPTPATHKNLVQASQILADITDQQQRVGDGGTSAQNFGHMQARCTAAGMSAR
jgi:hypothetical protein